MKLIDFISTLPYNSLPGIKKAQYSGGDSLRALSETIATIDEFEGKDVEFLHSIHTTTEPDLVQVMGTYSFSDKVQIYALGLIDDEVLIRCTPGSLKQITH